MKVLRVDKPWGHELLLMRTEFYSGKILCIRAGARLSLHHHTAKDETLYLLVGDALLELEEREEQPRPVRPMATDESYRVRPGQRHRLTALTEARVLEVSTPEHDDVVRWEDDYGRAGTCAGGTDTPLSALPDRTRSA